MGFRMNLKWASPVQSYRFTVSSFRTPDASSIFNLSDAPAEHIEQHSMNGTEENHKGKTIIHSKRKEKRKSRTERVSEKSSKTSSLSLPYFTRTESNSRRGRSKIARNEAEMSKGIKCTLSKSINKIQKARKALNSSHGKYPEDIEIARFTGLSLAEIRSASQCLRVAGSIDQNIGDWINAK